MAVPEKSDEQVVTELALQRLMEAAGALAAVVSGTRFGPPGNLGIVPRDPETAQSLRARAGARLNQVLREFLQLEGATLTQKALFLQVADLLEEMGSAIKEAGPELPE
jgi:hypothetical protein